MLHLRLRVPGDLTDEVVELLESEATVTNVLVVPWAFRKPEGCLVLADLGRENATAVIRHLRDPAIQGVVWRRVATRSRRHGLTR